MEKSFIPKLEKTAVAKEVALEKVSHLFKPLGQETINKNGEITIENNSIKIVLSYEDINLGIEDTPRSEEEFIGTQLGARERALIKFLDFKPEDYSLLKNYSIQNKINGSLINLNEELGENTKYVKKGGEDMSESASHYLNTYIKLNIEPKSAAGILTLMHEVGHKKDPAIDPLEIMLVSIGKEKEESILQKEMIDRERYAWAYSLSQLRPYLPGLNITKNAIDIFVHKWALGSYSASINPEIFEKETRGIFAKLIEYFKK